MDWCETRFAFELADVGADIEAGVEVDDDDDDDLSDDALDDDFFSFASCWAFFERFHFMRRFWNQIFTYNFELKEEENIN